MVMSGFLCESCAVRRILIVTSLSVLPLSPAPQLANRVADDAIAVDKISQIERAAGEAALRAVTSFDSVG